MRARTWDEEKHAAQVVVAMLGGRAVSRDPGGGPVPIHDFDVHLDDGRVVAVEVTRHTVEAELRQRAEVAREDPQFPTLRYNWHLGMGRRSDVKKARAEGPAIVAALEQSGIQSAHLNRPPDDDESPSLCELRSLGVRLLYRLREADKDGGTLDIGAAPIAGTTAPEVAVPAAEVNARRRGKADKLAAATADERHLFVWVETSRDDAVATMSMGVLPSRYPDVPDAVEVVWLATGYEHPHVWRYDRRDGWADWGTPTKPAAP